MLHCLYRTARGTNLTELVELVRERMDLSITGQQRQEDYKDTWNICKS